MNGWFCSGLAHKTDLWGWIICYNFKTDMMETEKAQTNGKSESEKHGSSPDLPLMRVRILGELLF